MVAAAVALAMAAPTARAQSAAPRDDAAWEIYHTAFAALADDREGDARVALEAVVRDHPDHPAAAAAQRVLASFEPVERDGGIFGAEADPRLPERPTQSARAELALFQTVHGIALGIEACIVLDCNEAVVAVGLATAGGGAALATSLGVFSEGIEPGRRGAIDSGTAWGAYNAAMFAAVAGRLNERGVALALLGGQVGGLAIGELAWRAGAVRDGQVALTNTFGLWSTAGALFALGLADADLGAEQSLVITALSTDVGLVAGGLAASWAPMSRSRTLVIDAGGIVGALGGIGTAVLIDGDPGQQLVSALGLLGMTLGLGSATFFTRDWDGFTLPVRPALLPVDGGGLAVGLYLDLDR